MILYRWQGAARNFGDELNTVLWPRLLPDFFDGDPTTQFLGIGSILDGRHTAHGVKLVAGSGYGGYEQPARLDGSWRIHWVRGPLTARLLGLPPSVGLGDPAVLLPLTGEAAATTGETMGGAGGGSGSGSGSRTNIGFMPHFESAMYGAWQAAAASAGVTLIDPRGDPLAIIAAIRTCGLLLSEALHGVIVADAMRIPWVAIEPLAPIHRPKWQDWAATLDLRIAFRRLPPSSLLEKAHASGLVTYHMGRRLLARHARRLRGMGSERFLAGAAVALADVARASPQLSAPGALDRCQSRMMERIASLPLAAGSLSRSHPTRIGSDAGSDTGLQRCDDSAYHLGLIG
jgi:hypothetical protein